MNNYIIFGILLTLIKHKKCSCGFLAEKFEVSKKTIYRYITELSASGIPIFCSQGKNGGIEIMPDFDLESNFFTTDEIARISTLLSTCEIGEIDKTTRNVLEKINHSLTHRFLKSGQTNACDQIIIDNLPWGVNKLYNKKILSLLDACNHNQVIKLNYTNRSGETTQRTINPYSLILKDGVWYLYAFCCSRLDFRLFKCSRIENFDNLESTFLRLPNKISNKPWLSTSLIMGNQIDLKLQVNNCALPDILDWATDAKVTKSNERSSIVTFPALFNDGLITRLLNFGDNIKIISPQKVANRLASFCQNIANIYSISMPQQKLQMPAN